MRDGAGMGGRRVWVGWGYWSLRHSQVEWLAQGLWAAATSLHSEDLCKLASGTVGHAKPPSYLSTEPPTDVPLLNVVSYRNDFTVCGPGPHRAAIHEVSAQHPAYSHIRLQAFDETDARLGFGSSKWCCRSAAGCGVPGGARRSQQGAC